MIFGTLEKIKVLMFGRTRVYRLYKGTELIYNCYAIPRKEVIWINNEGTEGDGSIVSNTQWTMK